MKRGFEAAVGFGTSASWVGARGETWSANTRTRRAGEASEGSMSGIFLRNKEGRGGIRWVSGGGRSDAAWESDARRAVSGESVHAVEPGATRARVYRRQGGARVAETNNDREMHDARK